MKRKIHNRAQQKDTASLKGELIEFESDFESPDKCHLPLVEDTTCHRSVPYRKQPFDLFLSPQILRITIELEHIAKRSGSLTILAIHQRKIIQAQVIYDPPADLAIGIGSAGTVGPATQRTDSTGELMSRVKVRFPPPTPI